MHTALIRRLALAPGDRLVTASDDKTIKTWQLPEGRLLSTLRVPIDAAHEGQLFALAVSPDGARIAAGGWTCWDWSKTACVYVFDAASGEIVKRVGGLPDAVSALAWSPDGRHLAVGLQGRSGVRILRTDTFAEVAADALYEDKLMELAYNRAGWLAAVALDGRVRVYRPDHRLHGRLTLSGGKHPATVRFAPDARRLAVGFLDTPVVAVLDMATLAPIATHTLADDGAQKSLPNVAWSADGRTLYAAGERAGDGDNVLHRFSEAQPRGALAMPARRVSELVALADGSIAYSAEDPRIGVIDREGRLALDRASDLTDFAAREFRLAATHDGTSIELRVREGRARRFGALSDSGRTGARAAEFVPPRLEAPGWSVEIAPDRLGVRVNGKVPVLDDYELVRTHVFTPDGEALVLGTEWALRFMDRDALERWRVKLAAIVRAVTVSGDGRFVIAALSDGTVRWFRARDGRELLAYFPHAEGSEWVAWTPAGYYMSSAHGDSLVGWHLNRGIDEAPDFYRAVQFERVLYRPDLVTAALRASSRGLGAEARFDASRLRDIAPPRLGVRVLGVRVDAEGVARARVRIAAERRAQPLAELTLFVDEIPLTPFAERAVAANERDRAVRELEIALATRGSELRVESLTGQAMGVAEAFVPAPAGARRALEQRGDLHILAIGNNAFPDLPDKDLDYAAQDAETIGAMLAARGRGLYDNVHMHVLSDRREGKATRGAVLDALAFARRARAEDTLIVFLASHGVTDQAGNYWFVPRDARGADFARYQTGSAEPFDSFISWTAFFDALRDAAGRRILIVDTCAARGMQGKFKPHALVKRSAASHFALIVASQEDEESFEYPPAGHGLFTYGLLQGFLPEADTDRDGRISIGELFAAAKPVVTRHGRQTPHLIGPRALHATLVAQALGVTAERR